MPKGMWGRLEKCGLTSYFSQDACRQFIEDFVHYIKEMEGSSAPSDKRVRKMIASVEDGHLPPSIVANQQPYMHRPWRKQPYEERPYDHIDSYQCEEDHEELLKKLKSTKPDGCSMDCLDNNPSVSAQRRLEIETALIQSVREKKAHLIHNFSHLRSDASVMMKVLRRGVDVLEIDTWGMDCYSRQNVYDAILDAMLPGVTVQAIHHWYQTTLSPTINRQKDMGWCLQSALATISAAAGEVPQSIQMATAVQERLSLVGEDYFRIHPKGTGVVCLREGGLPPFTLVEEYLGVLHSPWRWFEIQDLLKRQNPDEVPDFYNIILERPKTDPAGYEVTFVDAAAKGTFASRMSHSCDPNCELTVLSVDGRLTIAMYTTREVLEGQELTFDYASVTESEKEYRSAICLCASHLCRGSFLHYAGSGAFMHIMSCKHHFLHRNAMLLRAAIEPLAQADRCRLSMYGLRDACLGCHGIDRVPEWLEKWASLVLEYIAVEHRLLPEALMAHGTESVTQHMSLESAKQDARGVMENRLQNIAITIDKVRMCLRQECQPNGPPLVPLGDEQILRHLWTGENSIARRFFRAFVRVCLPVEMKKRQKEKMTMEEITRFSNRVAPEHPEIMRMCALLCQDVHNVCMAQKAMLQMEQLLRAIDISSRGLHTAAADVLYLYANTKTFFQPGQNYKGFTSKTLKMCLSCVSGAHLERLPSSDFMSCDSPQDVPAKSRGELDPCIFKKYGAHFIWGQLVMWYKQTVNDPTASLSAERRGTLSLPDIESCYHRQHGSYTSKDRKALLDQLRHRPDAMWKVGTIFTFKNEAKIYGSPMFDAVLSPHPGMTEILHHLMKT